MPIFEYRCENCDARVEKIQSRPSEKIECPECGKEAKKIVSLFSAADGGCAAPTSSGFG